MCARKQLFASLSVCLALIFGGPVKAATIDYIFTGTAAITLNGVSSFTTYKIDLVGDTANVTSGGGEFFNVASSATFAVGASTGTLLGTFNEVASESRLQWRYGYFRARPKRFSLLRGRRAFTARLV